MEQTVGDSRLDSPKRLARRDKALIKKKGIISPNTQEMLSLTFGNTTYYFSSQKKLNNFIAENKHEKITGFNSNEKKMDKDPGMVVEEN